MFFQKNTALFPANFQHIDNINGRTGCLEATLVYDALSFQINHSKLMTHGAQTVARTRKQLSDFLGLSLSKIDNALELLEGLNLIKKTVKKWFGINRMFISKNIQESSQSTNFKKLLFLNRYTGDYRTSILFSRIAYALNKTKIEHDAKKWCVLTKASMAKLLCVSPRTIDSILKKMKESGLIEIKQFTHNTRIKNHYTIPEQIIDKISKDFEQFTAEETQKKEDKEVFNNSTNGGICVPTYAKTTTSLIIEKENKDKNNNKANRENAAPSVSHSVTEDITFQTIGQELTPKQLEVLRKSINFAVRSGKLGIDQEEILEEMRFSILNPSQRQGISTFMHALNRCIKLLRNRDWKRPFGFNKYSSYGAALNERKERALNEHEERKKLECLSSAQVLQSLSAKEPEPFDLSLSISNLVSKFSINKK